MSDERKPKRGYRLDNGKALAHDLRVRIPHELHLALKSYAQSRSTTPAAAAREILREHLMKQNQTDNQSDSGGSN